MIDGFVDASFNLSRPGDGAMEQLTLQKAIARPGNKWTRTAGLLLFLGGLQWLLLVMVAETFFPNYSVNVNDISDLASTVPPNKGPVQPSATIFNIAMWTVGVLVSVAAFLLYLKYHSRLQTITLGLFGTGCILVGIFTGDFVDIHPIVSMIAFGFGPLSAIVAFRFLVGPLKYLSPMIGIAALVPLITRVVMGDASPILAILGRGGEERMIVYPVLGWIMAYGGYQMSSHSK